jgi:hypothetical protein
MSPRQLVGAGELDANHLRLAVGIAGTSEQRAQGLELHLLDKEIQEFLNSDSEWGVRSCDTNAAIFLRDPDNNPRNDRTCMSLVS